MARPPVRRQRSMGAYSYATSRYHQEYPPPEENTIESSFSPSSLRRASSETRLAVLQEKDVIANLERRMAKSLSREAGRGGARAMKKDVSQEFVRETVAQNSLPEDVRSPPPLANDTTTSTAKTAVTQTDTSYLNMEFEACIQEHTNTKVSPKIIDCLGISYKYSKLVAYYIFVILIGIPMTFVWGCVSGSAVFSCVWLWGPALKLFKLNVHSCAPVVVTPLQACCSPAVDVAARIFRQIRAQAIVLGQHDIEKLQIQNA